MTITNLVAAFTKQVTYTQQERSHMQLAAFKAVNKISGLRCDARCLGSQILKFRKNKTRCIYQLSVYRPNYIAAQTGRT